MINYYVNMYFYNMNVNQPSFIQNFTAKSKLNINKICFLTNGFHKHS